MSEVRGTGALSAGGAVWRSLLLYVLLVATFSAGIFFALQRGRRLEREGARPAAEPALVATASRAAPEGRSALGVLLLQILAVLTAARAFGALFRRFGQPAVIGEIAAGIVLGPSLFGVLAPRAFQFLFAPASLSFLKLLAELGVLLFLFVVGLELDLTRLRERAHAAVLVSHASIVIPGFLGVLLSLVLYRDLAPREVGFTPFALFLGIAMSITAFPVLARILEERGLTRTPLGTIAITSAAVDDATAWSLLAVVVAVVHARGLGGAARTIAATLLFVAAMLRMVRPLLSRAFAGRASGAGARTGRLAGVLLLLFASAGVTETIGIHALFGAFLAGVAMPRDSELRSLARSRLEEVSSVFLLPLFFAFTGLRTEIGSLADARSALLCLLVVAAATAGKLGGGMLTARLTRMGWRDAFALGALLNTRGLMELIALNVGYELGILTPRVFTMFVVMALVTTLATGPLLSLASRGGKAASAG